MSNFIRITFAIVFCYCSLLVYSQQEPHFTQYFDNALYVNPAYAGSKGALNITGIHREQWIGFAGRPRSTSLSIHSPLKYESLALGLTLVNDETGPVKQSMFYGDFSYSLRFKKKERKLSFGIKGGANFINVSTSNLETTEANDTKLLQNVRNHVNPNFGFGVLYHSPRFFIGASSPKLIEKSYDGVSKTNLEKRHFFGTIGAVIKVNNYWKLRPTAQIKLTQGAPISFDVSLAGIYNDKFYIGGMYRLYAAAGVFVQFRVSQQVRVGIAGDYDVNVLHNYNNGTLEIMASYDFIFKKSGIRSPRYF